MQGLAGQLRCTSGQPGQPGHEAGGRASAALASHQPTELAESPDPTAAAPAKVIGPGAAARQDRRP